MSGKLNDSRLIDFVDTDGVTYEFGGDVTGLEGGRRGVGILTYTVDEVERVDSRHDQLAFGLRTRQTSDATLVHITSDNSNDYIRLELVSLQLFYLLVLTLYFITSARRYCDHVSLLVGWLVCLFGRYAQYTPPTPTRRDKTVSSRRRCVLGFTLVVIARNIQE